MCTCSSCKATDALAGWKTEKNGRRVADKSGGFAAWPRGDPAGPRIAAAEYATHTAHAWKGITRGWEFRPDAAPVYPAWCRGAPGLPYPSKVVSEFIASGYRRKTGQAEAKPVSPASACKPAQHFRGPDRQPEACKIYTMKKRRPKIEQKQSRGRPALPGRRVVVKLEERHIRRAAELGEKNIAEGIRRALSR